MINSEQKMNTINFSDLQNWSVLSHLVNLTYKSKYPLVKLSNILKRIKEEVEIQDDISYKRATIKINNGGIFLRDNVFGKNIGTKNQYKIHEGQLLLSKIDARNGAFGLVPKELEGGVITGNFWVFQIDSTQILPPILCEILSSQRFQSVWKTCSNGTTNRHYLQETSFMDTKIPVPPMEDQIRILDFYKHDFIQQEEIVKIKNKKINDIEEILFCSLKIKRKQMIEQNHFLSISLFSTLTEWGSDKQQNSIRNSYDFPAPSFVLKQKMRYVKTAYRGKSPQYKEEALAFILNQKCNRWNLIDRMYAKTVDDAWYQSLDKEVFLKENDIIINSTGEGTLGRASVVTEEYAGWLVDSHILVLRLDNTYIDPNFIVRQINSQFGQDQVNILKGAQATKQTELGIENLLKMEYVVPIKEDGTPDLEMQRNIVSKINKLEVEIKEWEIRLEQLREKAKQDFENAIFG